ncbi:MAG: hypothetical protein AAF357_00390 [Verrucomicrobiota bacterium]
MWQEIFEKHGAHDFTVVGIAMDTEGVAPAKQQYERFGVTFDALVDPNYATRFEYVPWVFFVDEHGVVQEMSWKEGLKELEERPIEPVSEEIRAQWTLKEARASSEGLANLGAKLEQDPNNLSLGSELASRLIALDQRKQARDVLIPLTEKYDPLEVARSGSGVRETIVALADVYLQLSRAESDRAAQLEAARMAYFIYPTKGYIKQVVRIEGPEYFDATEDGLMDSQYRSAGIRKLEKERAVWFEGER